MGKERREDHTPGPTKFQVLAVKGVPTFLLLESETERGRVARRDAEGERLGALAAEIEARLPPPGCRPWPGGFAVTLGELAARDFFPRVTPPTSAAAPQGELYRALAGGRYVRALNFHATPRRLAGGLEETLSQLAEAFAPVTYDDLVSLATTGEWPHERPGVILNFFDGFRDNFEVVVPILDRLGLIGWFFVVSGWVTAPPADQISFAARHLIDLPYDEGDLPADGRLALSPEEVRALAERGHVVASHTRNHATASPELAPNPSTGTLEGEVTGSRRDLERLTGRPVRALAWREGTPLGASTRADGALTNAGYELLFANHAVQRVP